MLHLKKDKGKHAKPMGFNVNSLTGARHLIEARKHQDKGTTKQPYFVNSYGVLAK